MADSGDSGDSGGSSQPTLSDLYNQGVQLEKEMAQTHGTIKAAALTKASGVSPGSAKAMVGTAAPNRPPVDAATLDGSVTSGSGYEQYQKELATAVSTSTAMVRSAERLLDSAHAAAAGDSALALADDLAVTPLPDTAEGGPHATTGGEDGGMDDADPSDEDGEATASTGGPTGGKEKGDGSRVLDDPEARRQSLMAAVRSGRKVAAVGGDQPWTFIDAWYIIGPFTTGNSAGLNQTYSPESLVDLDARYTGPDGRALAWTYRKEAAQGTFYFPDQHSNAVNYAYTHLRSDRELDAWLAIGADDGMRLWLNDQPIPPPTTHGNEFPWQFSFGHDIKGYSAHLHFRGYRKVRLRQGLNHLLVRVENGPGGTGFALYLTPVTVSTVDAPPAP